MKKRNPLMMIRHLGYSIVTLIVGFFVFIFKKIDSSSSIFFNYLAKFKKIFINNNRVFKEGLIALFICAIGDLIAGLILGKMTLYLQMFPGLLVLIPGAIGMRGNIFGSLASRLGTNLNIGILSPEYKSSEILNQNVFTSLILTMVLSLLLGFIAKLFCVLLNYNAMSLVDFTLISVFAGLISSVIMIPITMLISLKSYQNGWNPDNVTTPLVAAVGDLFTLPAIILSLFIVGLFSSYLIKLIVFVFILVFVALLFIYGIKSNEEVSRVIKESTPVLMVCASLGVFAGSVLNSYLNTLVKNPSLLTLVPIFSGESGSLVSILGARLSSGLHSGLIEPILKPKQHTKSNFLMICTLAIIIYPLIAIMVELSSYLIGIIGLGFLTILISVLSGLILIPIMLLIVFYISTISFRRGLNPDNIVIPISTSITDFISNLILMGVVLFVFMIF